MVYTMLYHMVYTRFRSSSPAIPARVQPYTVCFRIQPVDPSAGLRLISIPRALPVRCGPVRPIETGPGAVRCGPVQPIKTGPLRCGPTCGPLKFDRVGILVETQSVFQYPDHNGPFGPSRRLVLVTAALLRCWVRALSRALCDEGHRHPH